MPEGINFYRVADDCGCFSNFAPYPIQLDGVPWPTSEHYFQAQKFEDPDHQESIRKEKSPMIAARMRGDRKQQLRADWESVKVSVMRAAVLAKFTQHDDLRELLLRQVMRRSSNTPRRTTTGEMVGTAAARTCGAKY